jgi:hypothetical protein
MDETLKRTYEHAELAAARAAASDWYRGRIRLLVSLAGRRAADLTYRDLVLGRRKGL